ncbi:hypothetical protein FDG2_2766 [Candidatus Protofrankia californiensis]|uniref:Nudix hydrolase domain-containing protein n=1 Tax=Candidatus Protofrankia californiensis TaxID=1839754 RepID=A0A1C3NY55_9ACTN|nr:hypothetical protein FDG2_2766 [Candidatus Protofrankia californiensis]
MRTTHTTAVSPAHLPGADIPRFPVDIHLMARWDRQILFTRRTDQGYWLLPTSTLRTSETATAAVHRVANEQVALTADPAFTWLAGVQHHHDQGGNRLGLYFEVRRFHGIPLITDRRVHDQMGWFPLDRLPEPLTEPVRTALASYQSPEYYTESGWVR